MTPFLVLLITTLLLRAAGTLGMDAVNDWIICLRFGLAAMFLLTASAHWGKRRPDLIRMVPTVFPRADLVVTITGLVEVLAAVGLLLPTTASAAAACLAVLLIAMFSANLRAAEHNLTIGGKAATPLPLRTLLQILFVAALIVAGFSRHLIVWSAASKRPAPQAGGMAKQANVQFWAAFHGGRYEEIPDVLNALTAAYLENPGDAETASHIGFAHVWRLSERSRLDTPPATITDEFVLARKYFSEASRLAPGDERIKGFLAIMELGEGSVHGDEKLKHRGYLNLMDAKAGWPEFNLFTAGYALSRLPFTAKRYAEAVDYQWQTLDLCADQKVDRRTVQYAQYMARETITGKKRACWNSVIAPHNFEGFFMNMGYMIVKQGDPATARLVYANARLSRTYPSWPFTEVLDKRIADADENVALFRQNRPGEKMRTMMVSSAFACSGCHQQ